VCCLPAFHLIHLTNQRFVLVERWISCYTLRVYKLYPPLGCTRFVQLSSLSTFYPSSPPKVDKLGLESWISWNTLSCTNIPSFAGRVGKKVGRFTPYGGTTASNSSPACPVPTSGLPPSGVRKKVERWRAGQALPP
jgi:hypothetical protein